MKNSKKTLLGLLLIGSLATVAAFSSDGSSEGMLPEHVKKTLDKNVPRLKDFLEKCNIRPYACRGDNVMYGGTWLPGYYIKYDVNRFKNAQIIKEVIKANSLHLMSPPEKYLYHVPGKPDVLSSENYLVIAKEVVDGGSELRDDQAKQLITCASKAGITDLHAENYVINKDSNVVIIDAGQEVEPYRISSENENATCKALQDDRRRIIQEKRSCRRWNYATQALNVTCALGAIVCGLGAISHLRNLQNELALNSLAAVRW